jgi:hypothetical protein
MTLPTVIEITPQLLAVTRDPFIDGLTASAQADEATLDAHGVGLGRSDRHGRSTD